MTDDYSPSNPLVPPRDADAWLDAIPKPIALTGGTGFVGSHLIDTLCAAGLRPRVLVRNLADPRWIAGADAEFKTGSLEDSDSLASLVEDAGTVIHLAGVLRAARAEEFDRGNRLGTANLVAAVRRAAPDARFVQISSLAAAGPSADPGGVGPEDPPGPVSAYGRSKLAGETEVRALADQRRWCILRPPAVYGPRDSDILEFFKMASRGVAAIPTGERWLTMVYVADVVRAVLAAAATGGHGEIYHLGEPAPRPLDEIFRQLADVGGCRVRILRLPTPVVRAAGLVGSALQSFGLRRIPLTLDKTTELLAKHWTSRTTESLAALGVGDGVAFVDGVEATWQWYRLEGWLR